MPCFMPRDLILSLLQHPHLVYGTIGEVRGVRYLPYMPFPAMISISTKTARRRLHKYSNNRAPGHFHLMTPVICGVYDTMCICLVDSTVHSSTDREAVSMEMAPLSATPGGGHGQHLLVAGCWLLVAVVVNILYAAKQ